jgi:hypothetical protein
VIDIIGDLLAGIIMSIPSKKQRAINKKFKVLKQQKWFKEKIWFNHKFRHFIENYDVNQVLENKGVSNGTGPTVKERVVLTNGYIRITCILE